MVNEVGRELRYDINEMSAIYRIFRAPLCGGRCVNDESVLDLEV